MKIPQGSDYHGNGKHYSKKAKDCCPCGDLDCPGTYTAQDHFEVEVRELVKSLPNNMELGEKIRELCS